MFPEPIPATHAWSGPILLLGMIEASDSDDGRWVSLLGVLPDGSLALVSESDVTTDWRYNAATKEWYDLQGAETEDPDPQPDEEVETA